MYSGLTSWGILVISVSWDDNTPVPGENVVVRQNHVAATQSFRIVQLQARLLVAEAGVDIGFHSDSGRRYYAPVISCFSSAPHSVDGPNAVHYMAGGVDWG